jgi:TDG/mug DNA glycosylase family protein
VLGVVAYRSAFGKPKAKTGLQEEEICGTNIWVLPNPSGLNAHYRFEELVRLFQELRIAVEGR